MSAYLLQNPQVAITIIIGIITLIISWWFNHNNLKIAHQKLEKELFSGFNERYDKLNDHLILLDDKTTLADLKNIRCEVDGKVKSLEVILIDYFNLCAEEYYWRKKKRISRKLWYSWQAGMKFYFELHAVKQLWEQEIKAYGYKAYYLKEGENFFKDEINKGSTPHMV